MAPNYRIPGFVYWLSRMIVVSAIKMMCRWRVEGKHYVPKIGPVVFGSNHIHNLDPIVIGASTRRRVQFMAKQELFKQRVVGRFLRYYGAFAVKRGYQDTAALKQAIQIPHNGGCVVIFPEGHRSKDGHLGKGMAGVALIARKASAPIIPVAIVGPYGFRKKLTVRFGAPLYPEPDDTNETLLAKLMEGIAALVEAGHSP